MNQDANVLQNPNEYVSTGEAAKILRVSIGTIHNMADAGEISSWRTLGGHRRISRKSLNRSNDSYSFEKPVKSVGVCNVATLLSEDKFQKFKSLINKKMSNANYVNCSSIMEVLSKYENFEIDFMVLDYQFIEGDIELKLLNIMNEKNLFDFYTIILVPEAHDFIKIQKLKLLKNTLIFKALYSPSLMDDFILEAHRFVHKKSEGLMAHDEMHNLYKYYN